MAVALCQTLFALDCNAVQSPSRWQGAVLQKPEPASNANPFTPGMFLELDSGGSGGSFGKGDIRLKLQDVFFWNQNVGWACGSAGAFRSQDGGLTWERMKSAGNGFHQVEMSGPEEVWLVEGKHPGGLGKVWLWHTTDNGKTWEEVLKGKIGGYADLFCRGNECWVLSGRETSYRSQDGGHTWHSLKLAGVLDEALKLAIPGDALTNDGFTIFIFGQYQGKARIIRSDDSGKNWRTLELPEDAQMGITRYGRLFFLNSQMGWVGLDQGKIYRTEDGGETWRPCPVPVTQRISAMHFMQTGFGLAALDNQDPLRHGDALYGTLDFGQHWNRILAGAKHIAAIYSRGPGKLWCVGDSPGLIYNDLILILTQEPENRSINSSDITQ